MKVLIAAIAIIVFVATLVYAIIKIYVTKQTESEMKANEENEKSVKDIFIDIITSMGCRYQYEEEENKERIHFAYQGSHFVADLANESFFVTIWHTHWGSVDLNDYGEVSRLKTAINESNVRYDVNKVYTEDHEDNRMYVHSRYMIAFVPTMPHLDSYLRDILNLFFHSEHYIEVLMQKLREDDSRTGASVDNIVRLKN